MNDNIKFVFVATTGFSALVIGGSIGLTGTINAGFDLDVKQTITWLVGLIAYSIVVIVVMYYKLPPDEE